MGKFETGIIKSECPYCGHNFDRVSGDGEAEPGSISICIACYSISIFNDSMMLRKPTAEEFFEIRNDAETWNNIQKMRWVLRQTEPDGKN
jgi:hypothetical protein